MLDFKPRRWGPRRGGNNASRGHRRPDRRRSARPRTRKAPRRRSARLPRQGLALHLHPVQRARRGLRQGAHGTGVIEKGDHVAVWGQNVPEWVTLQFATGKVGAVLVTINPAYKSHELKYVLEQSDAAALFLTEGVGDADFLHILQDAIPKLVGADGGELSIEELPFLKNVVLMGGASPEGLPVMGFGGFLERGEEVSGEELRGRQASLDAGEVINMQYTSGTTGFPKGVQLTHANIVKNAFYIGECMELGPEDRVCIPVPFFHCFGCVLGTLNTVTHEGTMVPVESFD